MGWMGRLCPVDEKWDESVSQHCLWIGIAPLQEYPIRPASAPGPYFRETYPPARRVISQTFEINALGRPRDELRFLSNHGTPKGT